MNGLDLITVRPESVVYMYIDSLLSKFAKGYWNYGSDIKKTLFAHVYSFLNTLRPRSFVRFCYTVIRYIKVDTTSCT